MNRRNLLTTLAVAPLAWLLPWRKAEGQLLACRFWTERKIGKAFYIKNAWEDALPVDVELFEPVWQARIKAKTSGDAIDVAKRFVSLGRESGEAWQIEAMASDRNEWIVTARLNA